MNINDHLAYFQKALQEAKDEGFKNGISIGLSSTERIAAYYRLNDQLVKPETKQTLDFWAEREVTHLKSLLK